MTEPKIKVLEQSDYDWSSRPEVAKQSIAENRLGPKVRLHFYFSLLCIATYSMKVKEQHMHAIQAAPAVNE